MKILLNLSLETCLGFKSGFFRLMILFVFSKDFISYLRLSILGFLRKTRGRHYYKIGKKNLLAFGVWLLGLATVGLLISPDKSYGGQPYCRVLFSGPKGAIELSTEMIELGQVSLVEQARIVGFANHIGEFGQNLVQYIVDKKGTGEEKYEFWLQATRVAYELFNFRMQFKSYYDDLGRHILIGPAGYALFLYPSGRVESKTEYGREFSLAYALEPEGIFLMEPGFKKAMSPIDPQINIPLFDKILNKLRSENRFLEMGEIYSALNLKGSAQQLLLFSGTKEEPIGSIAANKGVYVKELTGNKSFDKELLDTALFSQLDMSLGAFTLPESIVFLKRGKAYFSQKTIAARNKTLSQWVYKKLQPQRDFIASLIGSELELPENGPYFSTRVKSEFDTRFIDFLNLLPAAFLVHMRDSSVNNLIAGMGPILSADNKKVLNKRVELLQLLIFMFFDASSLQFDTNKAYDFIHSQSKTINWNDYSWNGI